LVNRPVLTYAHWQISRIMHVMHPPGRNDVSGLFARGEARADEIKEIQKKGIGKQTRAGTVRFHSCTRVLIEINCRDLAMFFKFRRSYLGQNLRGISGAGRVCGMGRRSGVRHTCAPKTACDIPVAGEPSRRTSGTHAPLGRRAALRILLDQTGNCKSSGSISPLCSSFVVSHIWGSNSRREGRCRRVLG
jgi:hypothetical protein